MGSGAGRRREGSDRLQHLFYLAFPIRQCHRGKRRRRTSRRVYAGPMLHCTYRKAIARCRHQIQPPNCQISTQAVSTGRETGYRKGSGNALPSVGADSMICVKSLRSFGFRQCPSILALILQFARKARTLNAGPPGPMRGFHVHAPHFVETGQAPRIRSLQAVQRLLRLPSSLASPRLQSSRHCPGSPSYRQSFAFRPSSRLFCLTHLSRLRLSILRSLKCDFATEKREP